MKKTLFIFLVSFTSVTAHAQLKNTKWKGTIQADNKIDVVFNYRNNTVDVSNSADGSNIETMTYAARDSVLTLQKISGQSNCDGTTAGKYKYQIKDDALYITLISDSCVDRSSALSNSKWVKMK